MSRSELRKIPGVGPKIEQYLIRLGYTTIDSLKGQDPEDIYHKDCIVKGFQECRCMLYVFRLVVYFAENEHHDPEKLKWQNWKDKV